MQMVGYVDGIEVKFDFFLPNQFKAIIPKQVDGTYIVQLHAVDEAGNITNYSNIFVKIDFKELSIKMLPQNYQHQENDQTIAISECSSDYTCIEINELFLMKEISPIFTYKELMS